MHTEYIFSIWSIRMKDEVSRKKNYFKPPPNPNSVVFLLTFQDGSSVPVLLCLFIGGLY